MSPRAYLAVSKTMAPKRKAAEAAATVAAPAKAAKTSGSGSFVSIEARLVVLASKSLSLTPSQACKS
jgi:hypothetical protein